MAEEFNPVAIGIQLDRAEQAGLIETDVAGQIRDLVAAMEVRASVNCLAGEDLREGDLLMRGDDLMFYRLRTPFRCVGMAGMGAARYHRTDVIRSGMTG